MLAFVTPQMLAKGANGAYADPAAPAAVKARDSPHRTIDDTAYTAPSMRDGRKRRLLV